MGAARTPHLDSLRAAVLWIAEQKQFNSSAHASDTWADAWHP